MITDTAGDQRDNPEHPDQDILSVAIAEPYAVDASNNLVGELTFTIHVSSLSTISTDGRWQIEWGSSPRHFVNMTTDNGNISYNYGRVEVPGNNVNEGQLDCASYDQAAGTITLTVSRSKVGAQTGTRLTSLSANTRILLYIPGPFVVSEDSTSPTSYLVQGNQSCSATTPMFCPPTTPTPLPSACTPPGNMMVADRAGDTEILTGGAPLPQLDIRSLAIAEPYATDAGGARVGEVTFTMTVSNLTVLPPSASWYIYFNHGSFVNMMNDRLNVTFNYGHLDAAGTNVVDGPLDCGSYDPAAGTITLTISNSKIGSPQPGQKLLSIYAMTFEDDPTGQPLSRVDYTFDKQFDYTLQGNQSCAPMVPNFCAPKPTPPPTPTPTPTPNGFGYQPPGHTTRISKGYDGSEGDGFSFGQRISADGRFIAFTSYADNLVPDDTNGAPDVFVYDRENGTTERVSVASDGSQADFGGLVGGISSNGRFVTFMSGSTNLVSTPALDGSNQEVFVHDRQTGVTELVSVSSSGQPSNDYTEGTSVSNDGRYVVFDTYASNIVPNDANDNWDIFVRDRVSQTTEMVSVASDGTYGNGGSLSPVMTPDGRYIAFTTFSTNLGPGERGIPNPTSDSDTASLDIYVRDRVAHTTARAYTALDGGDGNANSIRPMISANGRFVTFTSPATNFVPNGYPGQLPEIYVADRQTGEIEKVVAFDGERLNASCLLSSISSDGRYVAFDTAATNAVPNHTKGFISNIYVYDRLTKQTERISLATDNSGGTGDNAIPVISDDARFVAWSTKDKTLVSDKTTNMLDVFLHDRGAENAIVDLGATRNGNTLNANGRARLAGAIISTATDSTSDGASNFGAELTGASVTYRPEEKDLYFRINLANIPTTVQQDPTDGSTIVLVGSPNVIYVVYFSVGTTKYELRVSPPVSGGAFELWSCDSSKCALQQTLSGGFGTAGNDIRIAVPLTYPNLAEAQTVTSLRVQAGFGTSTAMEPLSSYDELNLPDATLPVSSVRLGLASPQSSESSVNFNLPTMLMNGNFSASVDLAQTSPCQDELFAHACVGSNCGSASSIHADLGVTCPLIPLKIVSRKTHGSAGAFDVDLTNGDGIECRSGGSNGEYTLEFTFANPLSSVSGATVANGTGSVATGNIDSNDTHNYVVHLTGVTNAQTVAVSLSNVTDSANNFSAAVTGSMKVLVGDTNADGVVNSADIGQTKAQSGQTTTGSNFREDVNEDGGINSADIGLVKSKSGTALP